MIKNQVNQIEGDLKIVLLIIKKILLAFKKEYYLNLIKKIAN
jgi:hypothetical protein